MDGMEWIRLDGMAMEATNGRHHRAAYLHLRNCGSRCVRSILGRSVRPSWLGGWMAGSSSEHLGAYLGRYVRVLKS